MQRAAAWIITRALSSIPGGWRPYMHGPILESFTGAWQQGVTAEGRPGLLAFSAVFSCVTGIAGDIAKNRLLLMRETHPDVWEEARENTQYSPVLRKPNDYQTRNQFVEQWVLSKLLHGNTYVLLERNNRGGSGLGNVSAMYVLDPCKVTPLISDETGEVFYRIGRDPLSEVFKDEPAVPAEDIIHDRWNQMFHPLIGVSPLYACSASAQLGSKISADSATFYENSAMPGGLISAPKFIDELKAEVIKARYNAMVGGSKRGSLLVLGDDMKFSAIRMTAEAAQTIEQLKWAVSDVARAFHYPEYRLGGPMPAYAGNIQAVSMDYYNGCLQVLIEAMEECLRIGLGLPAGLGVEVDIDNLLRMDTAALFDSINKGEKFMKVNEQRRKANLPPTQGGDAILRQEQDHSIEVLAERDKSGDPFGTNPPPAPEPPDPPDPPADNDDDERADIDYFEREFMDELEDAA